MNPKKLELMQETHAGGGDRLKRNIEVSQRKNLISRKRSSKNLSDHLAGQVMNGTKTIMDSSRVGTTILQSGSLHTSCPLCKPKHHVKIPDNRLGHWLSLDLFICFTSQCSCWINLLSLLCLVSLIGILRISGWASLVRTARIQALTLTTLVTMTAISRLTINQSAVKAGSWDNDGRDHGLTGTVQLCTCLLPSLFLPG